MKKNFLFPAFFRNMYFNIIILITFSAPLHAIDSTTEKSIKKHIKNFPLDSYKEYEVPGQGKFFLDDIDDGIKNILKRGFVWEPHLVKLIDQYAIPGTTVIDIGAHIGTLTMVMANKIGCDGIVHAFEPQKKIFRELYANCILNKCLDRVVLHNMAIGKNNGIIQMNPAVEKNEAATEIGRGGDFAEIRTLDSFNFKNVSLIKIDVERSENDVIDGMVNTLRENLPIIIIEIQGGHPWETATDEDKKKIMFTQNKLMALGYEVSHIFAHDYLAIPKQGYLQ